jgi:hypothetical protein
MKRRLSFYVNVKHAFLEKEKINKKQPP